METQKIKRNAAQCNVCSDIIESFHRHDFKYCSCENVAVEGGKDYIRRLYKTDNFTELNEYEG